jgi:hypothetical protein
MYITKKKRLNLATLKNLGLNAKTNMIVEYVMSKGFGTPVKRVG